MQWEVRGLDEMIVVFRHEKGEDPLEKEMATHSSVPALEIPWMGSLVGCGPWGHKSGT